MIAVFTGALFLTAVFELHRERSCRALLGRAEEANRAPVRMPIAGFADATRAAALSPWWGSCRDKALRLRLVFEQDIADPVSK